ncbi:MAG: GAF domain-containing protein, partial [Gammaproteobacteria bacterium]|nr:GAF domain-containing protein [Gammaproteobacteria bacterium]
VGGIGLFYVHSVASVSMSLVDDQAIPLLKINALEKSVWEMRSRLIVHAASDEEIMQGMEQEIAQFEKKVFKQMKDFEKNRHEEDTGEKADATPGEVSDSSELQAFRKNWELFRESVRQALELSQDFAKADAIQLINNEGREVFNTVLSSLNVLVDARHRDMKTLRDNAQEAREQAALIILLVTLLVGLCVGGLLFAVSRGITKPLALGLDTARQITGGNLTARARVRNAKDEIGQLLIAMNDMAGKLQTVISETGKTLAQLAGGNMDIRITGEFTGDFVEVKNALESTATQLGEAKAKDATETWLKTGQTRLSEQVSGDRNIKQLAENIIDFLTPYVDAQVGAFYLLEKTEGEEPLLRMVASHAYVWRKSATDAFKIREGLAGQAAYEQKMFIITQVPEDYAHIQSGLGESAPGAILVTPFLYEGVLKGVIELASFQRFTVLQLEFLKQVMPNIAIAVNTAESRTKMQALLEQSQAQSEALQSQSEEMRQTNEVLESQKQEMQLQQEKLQHSNEELQSQQEELQSQQEELRQTNEQLESRTTDLEKEREGIRIKNRELEKTRQAIQTKAEELELASKYKSEFLANMSHELRTPLNSLLILAQLLADNKDKNLNKKQMECARTIHASGIDLLALINEILDLSKVEAGKITIHAEEVPLDNLIKSVERKFLHIAKEKSVSFDIKAADNFPPHLHTDIQRLQQILNNLLSNAFKFTEQGGVTLEMGRPAAGENLSRSGLDPAEAVSISVSDTGIGIPKEKQKLVFEAFQQADGTTSRRFGGTGLGLSITRQLVLLLGGEIQLHSEENKGSRFTVYLPERLLPQHTAEDVRQTAAEMLPVPADDNAPARKNIQTAEAVPEEEIEDDRENLNSGDKSLLIIEDDSKFSRILADLAREKKFKVLLAGDGRHGLQMAEYYRPSAIILDIGLPQMDGWSVMEKLKDNSDTRHIPVHFVSGIDHHADARKMGAIGYSLKPVSMGDLGNAFNKIERFINNALRNVLIVADNKQRC